MKISVVIATYNGELFLRKQLDSILKQTMVPDEIIVSDDCSEDSTWSILKEYNHKYPDLFHIHRNSRNLGYALNFWNLLKRVTGDIIFLSDQDDIWYFDKVEKIYQIFCNQSDILALSTAYDLIKEDDTTYQDFRNVKFRNDNKLKKINWEEFVIHPRYPGMAMSIRQSLIEQLSFDEQKEPPAHDWILNQCAAYQEGMYFWDVILTHYRQHQSNTVGSAANQYISNRRDNRVATIRNLRKSYDILKELYKDNDDYETIRFIDRLIQLTDNRIKCIEQESFLSLLYYSMRFHRFVSLRSVLGDIYTVLKMKTERGKNYGQHPDGNL